MGAYDYVVVGAGSAGCVLAYRLTETPDVNVLLIEAGGRDTHPFLHMPRGSVKAVSLARFIWPYLTVPEAASNDAGESWTRGRTLGGSSSINGMVYVRGQDADYSSLAAVTSEDWSWSRIGAAYKALEDHELGPGPTRGGDGPLRVSLTRNKTALMDAAIEAGVRLGLERVEDVNDPPDRERIGYCPLTIYRGRRQSASVAFLTPLRNRKNLTIVTDVVVDRIEFEGKRAVGVRGWQAGKEVAYRAEREVLLSAGTLSTPAILQRSGIGPAPLLRSLGIQVLHDSPNVGQNLREHRGLIMQWRIPDKWSLNRQLRGMGLLLSVARYSLMHDGALADGAYDVAGWFKSRSDVNRPDGQILIAPYTYDYARPGMNICVYMLRPDSVGSVAIRTMSPADLPAIVPNYASAAADRCRVVDTIRFVRRLVRQPPLASMILDETRPGRQYATDEEIIEIHRKLGHGNHHASGSCRMGRDNAAPVDPQLKVRGVDGLRVIDTSIFPFMLSGNTNAPAMATAWRAADIITGCRKLRVAGAIDGRALRAKVG